MYILKKSKILPKKVWQLPYLWVWAGDDEDDHNKIDHKESLDDKEDGVWDKPGQELSAAPPNSSEIQEEVSHDEESQEDQLHQDHLVPPGSQKPLVDLQI